VIAPGVQCSPRLSSPGEVMRGLEEAARGGGMTIREAARETGL
jgi:hypothetical protein